jgi:arylsulfatase A-like enzyme
MRRFAAAALAAASLACGGAKPAGPNVLVITVDTLRADHLGCYGYARDTSPRLDAFAAESIRFARAYAQAPFTAPSHASLFTSLHSSEHGVLSWGIEIPAEARTMAERFGAQGFATGAFYNHPTLASNAIERGFEHVEKRFFEPAEDTLAGFLAWADGLRGEPFCAWVHLWDVHRPYGYRDWSADFLAPHVSRPALAYEEERFGTYPDLRAGRVEPDYNATPRERVARGWPEAGWRFIEDRYDGGVWYADRALGRLFDALKSRGLLENTVVVVTSDHGESLRERDPVWFTHDPYLYEETLRVPLLVRLPGGARGGTTSDALARGIDVLPTLCELCDLPATGMRGRSLLGTPDQRPRYLFAETQTRHAKQENPAPADSDGWFERRSAVSDGRRKLVVDANAGVELLFDLERDPGELGDVAADPAYADDLARLRRALRGFALLPRVGTAPEELSGEDRAALAALGYADGERR